MANYLHVQLIPSDVAEGIQYNCNQCPWALAINRVMAEGWAAKVYGSDIAIYSVDNKKNEIFWYGNISFPSPIRDWIYNYDRNKEVAESVLMRTPIDDDFVQCFKPESIFA